jgi:hypothetical protein
LKPISHCFWFEYCYDNVFLKQPRRQTSFLLSFIGRWWIWVIHTTFLFVRGNEMLIILELCRGLDREELLYAVKLLFKFDPSTESFYLLENQNNKC